jgi:molybdopterin synthase catalytic subunit
VQAPGSGDDWFAIGATPLPVGAAYDWCVRPGCGAVVLFSGTVRDHADGREGVEHLEYEAYEAAALERFSEIAVQARRMLPAIGRIALLHRVGRLELTESAVVVAVSAPHRAEAFEAARYAIDTLKVAAPIWKRETWAAGSDWGTDASAIASVTPRRSIDDDVTAPRAT